MKPILYGIIEGLLIILFVCGLIGGLFYFVEKVGALL